MDILNKLRSCGFLCSSWGDSDFYWHPTRPGRYEHWKGVYIRAVEETDFSDSEAMLAESKAWQLLPITAYINEGDIARKIVWPSYKDWQKNINFLRV